MQPSSALPTGHLERVPRKSLPLGGDSLAVTQLKLIHQQQARDKQRCSGEPDGLQRGVFPLTSHLSGPASCRASQEMGPESPLLPGPPPHPGSADLSLKISSLLGPPWPISLERICCEFAIYTVHVDKRDESPARIEIFTPFSVFFFLLN